MSVETPAQLLDGSPDVVRVPASTPWPMALAFGVLLLFGGLATSAAVSVLGAVAALTGLVGWFRQVLPREADEQVRAEPPPAAPLTTRREVVHLQVVSGSGRAWLPVEVYPISAGIRGGLAGGLTMAILALLYGLISGRGIWYPVNLLSAGFFPGAAAASTAELARFHAGSTVIAVAIHLIGSVCVGLLYGAMLPMLPRRPILLGGLVVPLLWSALFHSIIGIVNPVLKQHVSWPWFVVCQIGFGVVAGVVVSKRERVKTWQGAPLVLRAGIEAIGLEREPRQGKQP
jgi:hypothetical protein